MPITVDCPTCATKLKVPDNAVGKQVKCPKCSNVITVPGDVAAPSVATTAAPQPVPQSEPAPQDAPLPETPHESGPASEDDKTWGLLAHLAGTFFHVIGALVVYIMKKDQSAFLKHHTKESLNFQITMVIGWVVVLLLSCCCGGGITSFSENGLIKVLGSLLGFLPIMALGLANLAFTVMAALAAKKGDWYKYPYALRLIK